MSVDSDHDLIAAVQWWRALQPEHSEPQWSAGHRASLARLRRCNSPEQAAIEPAALELARCMGITHSRHHQLRDALFASILLSHVRDDDRRLSLGRQMGATSVGERALVSPLRLSRLLAAETFDERSNTLRRLVALLGGSVNLFDFTRLLLRWNEQTRVDLVFSYHNTPRAKAPTNAASPNTAGDTP